jgi:DNA-binding beta-propeller fold protein YncE
MSNIPSLRLAHRRKHRLTFSVILTLIVLATGAVACNRTPEAEPTSTPASLTATMTGTDVASAATTATLDTGVSVSPRATLPSAPALIEVIDLGGPAIPGQNPLAIATLGTRIYVANETSHSLSLVQGDSTQVIELGEGPYHLAASESTGLLYVAAEASRMVYVIRGNVTTNSWPLNHAPTALALAQGTLWAGTSTGEILRIGTDSGLVLETIEATAGGMIVDLVPLADGDILAATYSGIHLYGATRMEPRASRSYPVYRTATADEQNIYVCAYDAESASAMVEILAADDLTPSGRWSVADDTTSMAIDSARGRAYFSTNISNQVHLVDIDSGSVLASAVVGLSPQRVVYDEIRDRVLVTNYESDTLVILDSDLALLEVVPLAYHVTSLGIAERDGLYVGLNTGEIKSLNARGESIGSFAVGHPAALALLPDDTLAVLESAGAQLVLFDGEARRIHSSVTGADPQGLYYDAAHETLYAGDVALALPSLTSNVVSIPAGEGSVPPLKVFRDTRRDRLYAIAWNGTPGSNGGYAIRRHDGASWNSTLPAPGRLSVLDALYDDDADRIYSISAHMGEYGLQVADAETSQELYHIPLDARPRALVLDAPLHHLWVVLSEDAADGLSGQSRAIAYDTRVFAQVAEVRLNDLIALATVDPGSGRLYLAAQDRALLYVVQDVSLPIPSNAAIGSLPPGTPPVETPVPSLTPTPGASPSVTAVPVSTIAPAIATATPSPPTATPTASVRPTCLFPVEPSLVEAWQVFEDKAGCPAAPAMRDTWGWQPFEKGRLFWRRDTRLIVATFADGKVMTYQDFWREGMPDHACEADAPEGLWQPIRGFGLIWCQPSVRESLGWAVQPESAFTSTYQAFAGGVAFTGFESGVMWAGIDGTWQLVQP